MPLNILYDSKIIIRIQSTHQEKNSTLHNFNNQCWDYFSGTQSKFQFGRNVQCTFPFIFTFFFAYIAATTKKINTFMITVFSKKVQVDNKNNQKTEAKHFLLNSQSNDMFSVGTCYAM